MKAGKKRQIPANRVSSKSRSRSSSKKLKTSGKTKNCREGNDNQSRSRHNPSDDDIENENQDLDLDLDEETDRHLLDADNNDMPDVSAIDIEVADTEWMDVSPDFTPQRHDFSGGGGINFDDTDFKEIDYVSQFLDDEFWSLVATEKNRKAYQFFEGEPTLGPRSIFRSWYETNPEEMRKFIGLILLMGLVKKPRWRQYWSKDPLIYMPTFQAIMDRNRYEMIMKFFHFSNNENEPPRDGPNRDRLYKIRPLVQHFSAVFSQAFTPLQDICIDESLLLYKGRIIFKQYIPLKRARFGIKIFCLTDSNGYLHSFRIYSGKDDPVTNLDNDISQECRDMSVTAKTTLALMKKFLNKAYHLFIDNWYTSVPLLEFLHGMQTMCTGTARANRVPRELKNSKVPKGQIKSMTKGPLLAQKFEDKKNSLHDDNFPWRRNC